jgi:hypothetical protein
MGVSRLGHEKMKNENCRRNQFVGVERTKRQKSDIMKE